MPHPELRKYFDRSPVYEGYCCSDPRGAFTANVARPDVAQLIPGAGPYQGFDISIGIASGATEPKTYCVYAINTGAGSVSPLLGCKTVTLTWNPIGNFEQIRRTPGGVHLSGWTLDFDTTNSLEADVYEQACCSYPIGAYTANVTRSDVGAVFAGSGDNHGFEINVGSAPPSTATKTYCVYGINAGPNGSSSPQIGCQSITISPDVVGNYETAQAVTGGAEIGGWLIDPDVSNSVEIDVYEGACCTSPIGAYTANVIRPDVGAAWLDYGNSHGFDITLPLSPGTHSLCAYGINVPGTYGANLSLGCKTVVVT
jgi:hypothetical protein